MGPSKTTPTTGWSVITRSADQQRMPRCSRAQDSSSSQQPRCVLIAPHISSRSSTRWPVAEPPAPCRTFGAAANKLSGARRLRYWGGGPRTVYLSPRRCPHLRRRGWRRQQRRWGKRRRSYLRCSAATGESDGHPANLSAGRPAGRLWPLGRMCLPPSATMAGVEAPATSLQLGGGAACALQDIRHRRQQTARSPPPATLGWRAPGDPPLPSAGSSTSARLEVATTAVAATAAELPALRRRHCEAVAVIHRQAVGTRLAVSQ